MEEVVLSVIQIGGLLFPFIVVNDKIAQGANAVIVVFFQPVPVFLDHIEMGFFIIVVAAREVDDGSTPAGRSGGRDVLDVGVRVGNDSAAGSAQGAIWAPIIFAVVIRGG
jgi:hypothetical protein